MQDDEKVNILVVDDLPEKILVIETILEGLGQNIVTARSGREALRHLLDREFAVILLDVNMPDMDGLETAAMIRSRRQTAGTPIIFITAFTDEAHTAKGYSLGAVDYIFSPVVPEILRTKVGVFVELFKQTQQAKRQAEALVAVAREQAARAAAEEATRRSSFLAEASGVLTRSLDYDATLAGLARILVPFLCDFGAVVAVDERTGERKALVACDAPDGGRRHSAPSWAEFDPALAALVDRVLASGRPVVLSDRESPPSGPLRVFTLADVTLTAGTVIILPLEARGRVLGALALATGPSGRRPGPTDLGLAEELAGRAAIALDNARLYRDIQEDDRRKNEFLAMLAHELRNPLAPIRNSVQILQKLGATEGDLGWASDVISRQVEQMVRLVDDLLDISRITSGKIRLQVEPLDVAEVVVRAVETSRPLIESKGLGFTAELPSEPVWVAADRARLAQVLANVLNNAAKYTGEGGRIVLSVGLEAGEAVFRVRDTGVGIPVEMLPRVFDLFTQVDRSLDRSQGGLGIGLTLVRRLMEMHGGSVQARSDGPGLGSEFVLRMPAIPRTSPATADGPSASDGDPSAGHRVLIVDDNADSARSLSRLLRLSGHEVSTLHDGPSALERFDAIDPEFLFLDIGLPGMDGFEVARNIRRRPDGGSVVLVALTGYGREEDRRRSREAGFDHHLVKPVELDTLLALIRSCREPATASSPGANGLAS